MRKTSIPTFRADWDGPTGVTDDPANPVDIIHRRPRVLFLGVVAGPWR
jgi:hypothetical protein